MGEKEECLPYQCDLSDMYLYQFGCIINRFPDIVSDPESGNRYMSEVVDILGSSDGSPLVMMFERLYLCFRGPCSLIQHYKTIRENLELFSNIQFENFHNQLNGRHMEIPNPECFDDSLLMELPHSK